MPTTGPALAVAEAQAAHKSRSSSGDALGPKSGRSLKNKGRGGGAGRGRGRGSPRGKDHSFGSGTRCLEMQI